MAKFGKKDFIKKYAEHTGETLKQAEETLTSVQEVVKSFLQNDGDSLNLVGFLKFEKKTRPERAGRNPKTGESLIIPAKSVVKAKVSDKFGG